MLGFRYCSKQRLLVRYIIVVVLYRCIAQHAILLTSFPLTPYCMEFALRLVFHVVYCYTSTAFRRPLHWHRATERRLLSALIKFRSIL